MQPAHVQMPMMGNPEDPPPASLKKRSKPKRTGSTDRLGNDMARGHKHMVTLSGAKESRNPLPHNNFDDANLQELLRHQAHREKGYKTTNAPGSGAAGPNEYRVGEGVSGMCTAQDFLTHHTCIMRPFDHICRLPVNQQWNFDAAGSNTITRTLNRFGHHFQKPTPSCKYFSVGAKEIFTLCCPRHAPSNSLGRGFQQSQSPFAVQSPTFDRKCQRSTIQWLTENGSPIP